MSRDDRLYLEDMLESGTKIPRYTQGMNFKEFVSREMVVDAVLRNLEIIGEAAKNVAFEVRGRYPEIEWRKIAGLRNVLAHAYFALHRETLWDVVQNKIPALVERLKGGLQSEDAERS